MLTPSGYRAPAKCSDSRCKAKKPPVFVEERFNESTGRHQAEYECEKKTGGCGLLHVVNDKPAKAEKPAPVAKPAKAGKEGAK
jgi:hypothetical protein